MQRQEQPDWDAACPVPVSRYDRVVLGHGSGGRLSHELLTEVFLEELGTDSVEHEEDQAILSWGRMAAEAGQDAAGATRLAFTTDSFVVSPTFFPGGNVGDLAVNGTVNDLCMGGAVPEYLSAAFILEEGFPIASLRKIVLSMRRAADEARVRIVTGDTKVVERGKGDGVYVTTSGVGRVPASRRLSAKNARPGDRVLVSGTLGDHGIAMVAVREGIELETSLVSDTRPLVGLVEVLLQAAPNTRALRDPTRGGLSSSLNEIARSSSVAIRLEEVVLPIRPEVKGACELLGLDPLYVANEGKLVAIVPPEETGTALEALRQHPDGKQAAVVGEVTDGSAGRVTLRSSIGGERVVSLLSGQQLPRIC